MISKSKYSIFNYSEKQIVVSFWEEIVLLFFIIIQLSHTCWRDVVTNISIDHNFRKWHHDLARQRPSWCDALLVIHKQIWKKNTIFLKIYYSDNVYLCQVITCNCENYFSTSIIPQYISGGHTNMTAVGFISAWQSFSSYFTAQRKCNLILLASLKSFLSVYFLSRLSGC